MRSRLPSPAMVVALAALLVALSGTAVAAGVVPLAKRALVADNAKKLGGRTPAQVVGTPGPATVLNGKTAEQVAAMPGPASSIAGALVIKTSPAAIAAGELVEVSIACDPGQKVVSGGFDAPPDRLLFAFDTRPSADGGGWRLRLSNGADEVVTATLYAICAK